MIEKRPIEKNILKELLDNGYTWLKRDDLGFGSVQEKFNATDAQIALLQKHPLAKGLETTAVIFTIVDTLNNESATDTRTAKTTQPVQPVPGTEIRTENRADVLAAEFEQESAPATSSTANDELAAFANL